MEMLVRLLHLIGRLRVVCMCKTRVMLSLTHSNNFSESKMFRPRKSLSVAKI